MSTFTLSVSSTGTGDWGDIALVFRDSGGPGVSASGTGTGAPSLAITTTGDHSAVCLIVLDANAVSGTSRTWLTVNGFTPSAGNGLELGYTLVTGTYGIYIAYWPDAGLAGTKTVGLSAPAGMKYTAVATEILGSASAPSVTASLPAVFSVAAHPPWIGAQANLAAGFTLSGASLDYPIQSAALPVGLSLTGGPVLGLTTVLPVAADLTADATGWTYIGQVPLTYLQYLQPAQAVTTGLILAQDGTPILDEAGGAILDEAGGGTSGQQSGALTAVPGQFFTTIGVASGWSYPLPVPPEDGRWLTNSGAGPLAPKVGVPLRRGAAPTRRVHARHGDVSLSAYQAAGAARSRR